MQHRGLAQSRSSFVLGNSLIIWRSAQDSEKESILDQKEDLVRLISGIPASLCAPLFFLREGPILQCTIRTGRQKDVRVLSGPDIDMLELVCTTSQESITSMFSKLCV